MPLLPIWLLIGFVAAGMVWKSVTRRRPNKVIGEIGFVGSNGLSKHGTGEVTLAGVILPAELESAASLDSLEAGSQVIITETSGAKLKVRPK